MYVEKILSGARERLVTISGTAALVEAAKRLRGPGTDLVVVCDADGAMCGVISKTDVVDRISQCSGASCTTPLASVMTRDVVSCRPGNTLREVWSLMKTRGLKHVPVIDRPRCSIRENAHREVFRPAEERSKHDVRRHARRLGRGCGNAAVVASHPDFGPPPSEDERRSVGHGGGKLYRRPRLVLRHEPEPEIRFGPDRPVAGQDSIRSATPPREQRAKGAR